MRKTQPRTQQAHQRGSCRLDRLSRCKRRFKHLTGSLLFQFFLYPVMTLLSGLFQLSWIPATATVSDLFSPQTPKCRENMKLQIWSFDMHFFLTPSAGSLHLGFIWGGIRVMRLNKTICQTVIFINNILKTMYHLKKKNFFKYQLLYLKKK